MRDGVGVCTKCLAVALAVHETRRSGAIGLNVSEADTEAFWTEFMRCLVGVRLAISDAVPRI